MCLRFPFPSLGNQQGMAQRHDVRHSRTIRQDSPHATRRSYAAPVFALIALLVAALIALFLIYGHRGTTMREPVKPIPTAKAGAGNGGGMTGRSGGGY